MKTTEEERVLVYERYAETIPKSYREAYLRACRRQVAGRGAIKANCQQCMGYERCRVRIRDCRIYICPLWKFRPYQNAKGAEEGSE